MFFENPDKRLHSLAEQTEEEENLHSKKEELEWQCCFLFL